MGFFQTLKNKLGIGGVSVSLQVPPTASKSTGTIEGKLTLTTKSDQDIVEIKVLMKEEFSTGKGQEKKTRHFTLGEIKIAGGYPIKTGENKEIAFTLPFKYANSDSEDLKKMGGALGALGALGAMASNERTSVFVEATVSVKGVVIGPSSKQDIRLV